MQNNYESNLVLTVALKSHLSGGVWCIMISLTDVKWESITNTVKTFILEYKTGYKTSEEKPVPKLHKMILNSKRDGAD